MKLVLIIILACIATTTQCQINDMQRFTVDTGKFLPDILLIDKDGKEKKIEDFKGRILYIGIWASSCGSSISKFPYQEQLLKRLTSIQIDTSIQLINIHIDDSRKEWLKSLKKYNPVGANLFCSDTSILTKWDISATPTYILLDKSGKLIARDISQPDEAGRIDYILYSLAKGINIIEALSIMFEQQKLMEQHRTSTVISNDYFKNWFDMTINSFIEFQNWRTNHTKKNSR